MEDTDCHNLNKSHPSGGCVLSSKNLNLYITTYHIKSQLCMTISKYMTIYDMYDYQNHS